MTTISIRNYRAIDRAIKASALCVVLGLLSACGAPEPPRRIHHLETYLYCMKQLVPVDVPALDKHFSCVASSTQALKNFRIDGG